jgi:hypothetical protein
MFAPADMAGTTNDFDQLMEHHMLKHVLVCAAFVASATVGSVNAPQSPAAAQGIGQAPQQKMQVPGTNYKFVLGSVEFPPGGSPSTDALLTALVFWISDNFDLPASYNLPKVELMPATKITSLFNEGLSDLHVMTAADVVSVYNTVTKTIYLREDWTGSSPAELSILVHEIVHHLQNLGNLKFKCPMECEELAYKAQEQWLGLFGRDLLRDFGIDSFTLLMYTKCHY